MSGPHLSPAEIQNAIKERLGARRRTDVQTGVASKALMTCVDTRHGALDCKVLGNDHARETIGRYAGSIAGAGRDGTVVLAVDDPEAFRAFVKRGGTDVDAALMVGQVLEDYDTPAHYGCLDMALVNKTYGRIADGDTTVKAAAEDTLERSIPTAKFKKIGGVVARGLDEGTISDAETMVAGLEAGGAQMGHLHGNPLPGASFVMNKTLHTIRPMPRQLGTETTPRPALYVADPTLLLPDITVAEQRALSPQITPATVEEMFALHHGSLIMELGVPVHVVS